MLTDDECLAHLEQIAAGRSHKDMVYLSHLAHEQVARTAERGKHAAMRGALHSVAAVAKAVTPDQSAADWQAKKGFLLDGQGSHLIDLSLGLAVAALLDDQPEEFEFQIRAVFKSALLGLPHVLRDALSKRMPQPNPHDQPKGA